MGPPEAVRRASSGQSETAPAASSQRGLRHKPPAIQPEWIRRERLLARLERRFELDALVLVAPAGYGKTTLLAQALSDAHHDRVHHEAAHIDLWFQCSAGDGDAEVLANGLLQSTGLTMRIPGGAAEATSVADALMRFAPRPACLIIDDLHLIPGGSPGMALLDELMDLLPGNVHLVLSGRTAPPLRLARRRVHGSIDQLGQQDLAFDEHEAERVLGEPQRGEGGPTDWPVLASLLRDGRPDAIRDFLVEEVTPQLGTERLVYFAALAHLPEVDESAVNAVSRGTIGAVELFAGVPLVQRSSHNTYQMHDLWREALAATDDLEPEVSRALCRVAEDRLATGRFVEAVEEFAEAGNRGRVEQAVHAFAMQPLMFVDPIELRQIARLADQHLPESTIGPVLTATLAHLRNERLADQAFSEAADAARQAGNAAVEALALRNLVNLRTTLLGELPDWVTRRARQLADRGDPVALSLHRIIQSHLARWAGRPDEAAGYLRELAPSTSEMDRVQYAFGLCDLGRPEEVGFADDGGDPTAELGRAGAQYLASAMWLRGDFTPETALELGTHLAVATEGRKLAHLQISTHAGLTLVALAAGDLAAARHHADAAATWSSHTPIGPVRGFALLADAATVMVERGEQEARHVLGQFIEAVPLGNWPQRPYFYALCTIYVLAPESRPLLDRCQFGPALSASRDAGAALVRLREHDDAGAALELPWHRPSVLRAHVLPPHLVELGAAAAAAGHPDVGGLLRDVPDLRRHLHAAAELSHGPAATWARDRIQSLPAQPHYEIQVGVLGATTCERGDTEVTDGAWVRRERVRQLLALLLLHRRITRQQLAGLLWPDLEPDKAGGNLRVNLSHLQRVLQPGRESDAKPWFLRSTNDVVEVASTGFDVDADRFEEHCSEARRLDQAGQGTDSLEHYRHAAELYRGDYLAEWPDLEWASVERFRLRALAMAVWCRLGELLMARGEPEEAATWAGVALRIEPLHERAHLVFIRSLLGQGDRAGAVRALRELTARLDAEGLSPDGETVALAARMGVLD